MDDAQFYFIKDSYFEKFQGRGLMENEESEDGRANGRPYFPAFPDKREPRILWMVPVSSKIRKYKAIREKNIEIYGRCSTVVFGELNGRQTAFLIQNVCPALSDYLTPYRRKDGEAITIDEALAKRIRKQIKKLMILSGMGLDVIFSDIWGYMKSF